MAKVFLQTFIESGLLLKYLKIFIIFNSYIDLRLSVENEKMLEEKSSRVQFSCGENNTKSFTNLKITLPPPACSFL